MPLPRFSPEGLLLTSWMFSLPSAHTEGNYLPSCMLPFVEAQVARIQGVCEKLNGINKRVEEREPPPIDGCLGEAEVRDRCA